MGIVLDELRFAMMDSKECMACEEYRKFNGTKKVTTVCQKCPNYSVVFKVALEQLKKSGRSTLS